MGIGSVFTAATRNYLASPADGAYHGQLRKVAQGYKRALQRQYSRLRAVRDRLDDKRAVLLDLRSKGRDAVAVPAVNELAGWMNEQLQLTGANPSHYRDVQAAIDYFLEQQELLGGLQQQVDCIEKTLERITHAGKALTRLEELLSSPPLATDVAAVRDETSKVYTMLTGKEGLLPRQ